MSDKAMKWAFVSDLQIPYQDDRAVKLWFKAMKAWKPDAIDILGDIDDQLEYSTFSDGTTDEFFNQLKKNAVWNEKEKARMEKQYDAWSKATEKLMEEDPTHIPQMPDFSFAQEKTSPIPFIEENAKGARKFYEQVRKDHPNADINVSLGNHDMRIFKYIDKKAPEVVGQLTPEFLWGLDSQGMSWTTYDQRPQERFAGIHVHHGNTTTDTGLAVRGDIEKYGVSLVRGHDHRGGVVYKSYPMPGRGLVGMGTGHLTDIDTYGMKYADNPCWEQGFGIAHVYDGRAHLQFIPMRHYVVIIDGKVIEG